MGKMWLQGVLILGAFPTVGITTPTNHPASCHVAVINVTLPDDKQNYVHRIGRVGRADRMGLAISLVSKVKEKVIW